MDAPKSYPKSTGLLSSDRYVKSNVLEPKSNTIAPFEISFAKFTCGLLA